MIKKTLYTLFSLAITFSLIGCNTLSEDSPGKNYTNNTTGSAINEDMTNEGYSQNMSDTNTEEYAKQYDIDTNNITGSAMNKDMINEQYSQYNTTNNMTTGTPITNNDMYNTKSSDGMYISQLDANSIQVELTELNGQTQQFRISEDVKLNLKNLDMQRGDKIKIRYQTINNQKVITGIDKVQ